MYLLNKTRNMKYICMVMICFYYCCCYYLMTMVLAQDYYYDINTVDDENHNLIRHYTYDNGDTVSINSDWPQIFSIPKRIQYSPFVENRYPTMVAKRNSNNQLNRNITVSHLMNQYIKKLNSFVNIDPKIVKDLSNIFGKPSIKTNSVDDNMQYRMNGFDVATTSSPITSRVTSSTTTLANKQSTVNDEPLKKKSINWSNYFGIDRRKKLYNHMVKRNGKEIGHNVDDKLRNMEDKIIDEAVKLTGAHEDEDDPKEVQDVKDKLISRLVAAYNLEKMRAALSKFKSSLIAQKYATNDSINNTMMKKKNQDTLSNKYESKCYKMIERHCQNIAAADHYNTLFFNSCLRYQLCLLCKNDEKYKMDCRRLYVTYMDVLCQSNIVCWWSASRWTNPEWQSLQQCLLDGYICDNDDDDDYY